MASLLDNLKKNTTLNIDKENLEIHKKVAKKQVSSFIGAFTGVHPTETEAEKEAKRKASIKRDEYREEHNKMFAGYDGSRRTGPIVTKEGRSAAIGSSKMKQNGEAVKAQTTVDPRYGSKMRVSGNGGYQNMRAVKDDRPSRVKEEKAQSTRPVKGKPGVVAPRKPSEEFSTNRFASELKKNRENKNKK